jgi:hypothetical protein
VQERANLAIFQRQDLRQHFDEGYFAAKSVVEVGELHAYGAGANDYQRLRHLLQEHGLGAAQHPGLIKRQVWQRPRPRPGGQDDVRRAHCCHRFPGRILHRHHARPGKLPAPSMHLNLVFAQQKLDALLQTLGHLTAPPDDLAKVNPQIITQQAKLCPTLHQMVEFGIAQQRFARNAPPVETDATQGIALHQRDLHPQLGRPDCRHIATRAATNHNEITRVLCRCHTSPSSSLWCTIWPLIVAHFGRP